MSHTSEKRWPLVAEGATEVASAMVHILLQAESAYQELLELYAYAGNTAQGLADLLFKDVWEQRSSQGVQAVLSMDVVGGIITDVTVNDGGTGYVDGIQYIYPIQGGAGDGQISYDVVAGVVGNAAVADGGTTYNDGTGVNVVGFPAAGLIPDTQANAEEVQKATDLVDVATSLHEMYQAADNVAVGAEDRFTALRRFT